MALNAYTGIPGSGKSHDVVKSLIVPALQQGRTIVHNLKLHEANLLAYTGAKAEQLVQIDAKATFDQIIPLVPPGALCIFDEFLRYFPAGMKAHTVKPELIEFFSMHRHSVGTDGRSMDIAIVCQNLSQVASFIRDLVETTYRFEKLVAIGQENRFRCDVWNGPIVGRKPPGSPLRSLYGTYDPQVFPLYVSQTQSITGQHGSEKRLDSRVNVLKGGRVKLALAALVVLPVIGWLTVQSFFAIAPDPKPKAQPPAGERSDPAAAVASAAAVVSAKQAAPKWSNTWRMAGQITRPSAGGEVVILQSNTGIRLVKLEACLKDDAAQLVCNIDGELIAAWTGVPDRTVVGQIAATPDAIKAQTP